MCFQPLSFSSTERETGPRTDCSPDGGTETLTLPEKVGGYLSMFFQTASLFVF